MIPGSGSPHEDLSSSTSQELILSWDWWSNNISSSQGLDVSISNNGIDFTLIDSFRDDQSNQTRIYSIPSSYFTADFAVRFEVMGSAFGNNRYCYIDNIEINATSSDQLYIEISNNGGTTWPVRIPATGSSISIPVPQEYLVSDFKMRFYLDGFSEYGEYVRIADILISDDNITFMRTPG